MLSNTGRAVRLIKADENLDNLPLESLSGLVMVAPAAGTDDSFLENAFLLMKQASSPLRRSAEESGAFLCTISRLDGAFGIHSTDPLADPLSGGLAGLSKTASHEWPEISCKAIDLGTFPDSTAAAQAVADELFQAGPLEVGLTPTGRTALTLTELPAVSAAATPPCATWRCGSW